MKEAIYNFIKETIESKESENKRPLNCTLKELRTGINNAIYELIKEGKISQEDYIHGYIYSLTDKEQN